MNSIETLVRDTLRERSSEAPEFVPLDVGRSPWRRTTVGALAMAGAAAAAVVALVLTTGTGTPAPPVASPSESAASFAAPAASVADRPAAYATAAQHMLEVWAAHNGRPVPTDIDVVAALDPEEQPALAEALAPRTTVHWASVLPQTRGEQTGRPGLELTLEGDLDRDRVTMVGNVVDLRPGGIDVTAFHSYLARTADGWTYDGEVPPGPGNPRCTSAAGDLIC